MTEEANDRRRALGAYPLAALAASTLTLLAGCASDGAGGPVALSQTQQGRTLAQRECATCHAIGELGQSPRLEAPPLRDVLDRYSGGRLKMAFQEGMIVGHVDMPIYTLSEAETDALLAYLQDIRR